MSIGEFWPQKNLQLLLHSTTTDSSGNNRNATITGTVTTVKDLVNGAFSATWNNSNYVSAPCLASNLGTGNVSFGVWFRKTNTSVGGYNPPLVSIGTTSRIWIDFNSDGSGTWNGKIALCSYDGSAYTNTGGSGNYADGKPHLAIAVRNGTTLNLYIDGELETTVTGSARNVASATLMVGCTDYANFINSANVGEIFVFDKVLTASEIKKWWSWSKGRYL